MIDAAYFEGIGRLRLTLTPSNDAVMWEHAGFADRLFADIADGVIALLLAATVYFAIDRWALGEARGLMSEERPFGVVDAVLVLWFVWNLTFLVGRTGQSWGRKLAGLKVVDAFGEPVGFWRALGRNLSAGFVSAPPLYLGFLWVIWDPQKQAWHDKVFRSYVVRRSR